MVLQKVRRIVMSFIDFGDIATGGVTKQFNKINLAKKQIDAIGSQISANLAAAKIVNESVGLPSLPDMSQINGHFTLIDANLATRLSDLGGSLSGLSGGCLGGAKGAMKSLALNPLDMTTDLFDFSGFSFPDVDFPETNLPFPSYALDLSGLFAKFQLGVGSLGISDMIQNILSKDIPCLGTVGDAVAQVGELTTGLGLELDGSMTTASFSSYIDTQMSVYGLPSSLGASLTAMTAKQVEIATSISTFAKQQSASFVPPIVKTIIPKGFY